MKKKMAKYRKVKYEDGEEVFYWDYDTNTLSKGEVTDYTDYWCSCDYVKIKKPYKYLNARQVNRDKDKLLDILLSYHERKANLLREKLYEQEATITELKKYKEF